MSFSTTPIFRKISPYLLFLKDVTAKRKPGTHFSMAEVAKKYKQLSASQRAALIARSNKFPNPSGDKYRSFVKQLNKELSAMPLKERQREISKRWHDLKKRLAPKAAHAALKPKKISAHKAVKKAAVGASK
ncbi:unnamed protein product [Phytomonas sp. Hart1]|nr:unnamed protein product [Phytomonas sp. Hart1]|eukprot:CCW68446.1 unnamed protein product [Phytomonas sp. isolate Hart1]